MSVQPGQLAFLYGYEPVVVFAVEDDGKLELARFGSIEFHPEDDVSLSERGPRPVTFLPPAPPPEEKIATLEAQVATLTQLVAELVTKQSAGPPAPTPAPPSAAPEPASASSTATPVFPFFPASESAQPPADGTESA